ncbi:4'-phosphopantetheinyl transferase [Sphaerisporangium melleum]|uniref:4'-phosphopantetheinyl transferase family protein n=1 Tax=Sphaerisporangium melleum TaxID=321316 RepID=UPI001E3E2EED|nr:4'-phosphopantetheinyl transferase superfamily protein [Sphaerisporangium melleum]
MNAEPLIGSILPPWIAAADTFDDHEDGLFAEEQDVVRNSVDKRRAEFTTGRVCARTAMGALGVQPQPLLPGVRGEPQWPKGLVGSITHCAGYRAAAVGARPEAVTIGIDAEPDQPVSPMVLDSIAQPEERAAVRTLTRDHPGISWDRLLFSAKESVYKAWFPLTKRWLDFENAQVTIDPVEGSFSARLLVNGPSVLGRQLTGFSGRWLAANGLILTAIVVSARPDRTPRRP